MKINIAFFILTISLNFCGKRPAENAEFKNVYGVDPRVDIKQSEMNLEPYKFLGKFSNGCTGTVVGKGLVLTALHCVLDTDHLKKMNFKGTDPENVEVILKKDLGYFELKMNGGNAEKHARPRRFWHLTKNPLYVTAQDWALVEIDMDLTAGQYFKVSDKSPEKKLPGNPLSVNLVGYSTDQFIRIGAELSKEQRLTPGQSQRRYGLTPSEDKNCLILNRNENEVNTILFHRCSATKGSSGAPMYNQTTGEKSILAIHTRAYDQSRVDVDKIDSEYVSEYILEVEKGHEKEKTAGISVPASNFYHFWNFIKDHRDSESLRKIQETDPKFKKLIITNVPEGHKFFKPMLGYNFTQTPIEILGYKNFKLGCQLAKIITKSPVGQHVGCKIHENRALYNSGLRGMLYFDAINDIIVKDQLTYDFALSQTKNGVVKVSGWDSESKAFYEFKNIKIYEMTEAEIARDETAFRKEIQRIETEKNKINNENNLLFIESTQLLTECFAMLGSGQDKTSPGLYNRKKQRIDDILIRRNQLIKDLKTLDEAITENKLLMKRLRSE